MSSNTKNEKPNDFLEIKAYVPTKLFNDEKHLRFYEILNQHPRDRKYLSHKEYLKYFAPDTSEAKDLVNYAKSQDWEVEYVKKTREVTIKVPSLHTSEIKKVEEDVSSIDHLKFFNSEGDISLDTSINPEVRGREISEEINDIDKPPILKNGFIKNNQELRVGNREGISMQNENHGHSVLEVAEAYNFPEGDGTGQTIGIIELGGQFEQRDIDTFFKKYGIDSPKIKVMGTPSKTPLKENVEVTADIQVAGILAPKAKLVVYYGTSILNAMKVAVADGRNKPSIISISWAGSEMNYSQTELNELYNIFYEASLKGITVVAASGDNGAFNNKNFPNVNVPANSPFVVGCGGTKMEMFQDKIAAEVVWNESRQDIQIGTGGGFSQRINQPPYQRQSIQSYLSKSPQFDNYDRQQGRGIPDVAGNAADASGYSIYFGGKWMKIGGTSLATPLWAALIARMNENLGYNLGFINVYLYKLIESEAFHPVVEGNNNLYLGALGWNPCTGLGTPNGKKLQEEIKSMV